MARPRTPSNILEMKGAFRKDPQRRRQDLDGVGTFNPMPPSDLPQELVSSWQHVVKQINPAVLTASDYSSIECMARLTLQMRLTGDVAVIRELRQWYAQYGMTAVGRTKIANPKGLGSGNTFRDV